MANFDTGVARYIKCKATVEVAFPVDEKGNSEVNCFRCKYLTRNTDICQLTKEVVPFPKYGVGNECPLVEEKEE